jgi:hypothetical protein
MAGPKQGAVATETAVTRERLPALARFKDANGVIYPDLAGLMQRAGRELVKFAAQN